MEKAAIVTGGSSGIGKAVARRLIDDGYGVVLVARGNERLEQVAREFGSRAIPLAADVSVPAACNAVLQSVLDHFGRLDVLVNSAGAAPLKPIDQTSDEAVDEAFAVNAMAPARLIARAWPIFKEQKSGCIVTMSAAVATGDPFPGFFAYAAAKASVGALTRSAALEGKRIGVKAFAIAPGAVDTPILRNNFPEKVLPASKCLKPEQVAGVILACINGERADDNGKTINLPAP